jgi:Fe-S oxidoreductase
LALRDEYLDFFPGDGQAQAVAGASQLVEEFLTEPGADGTRPVDRLRPLFGPPSGAWRLHPHCHARSLAGSAAPLALMRATGAPVDEIPAGCCGMAGAFGYEREHYALSLQIGELALLPAARAAAAAGVRVAAQGVSCRSQLADGAGVKAVHPIEVVAEALAP